MLEYLEIGDLVLENGTIIRNVKIAYNVYGNIENAEKIIWICHALTANSDAETWWPEMIGKDEIFNTEKHAIICANVLGSCYGTAFECDVEKPLITIRDMVSAHQKLADFLNITSIDFLCGGSLGGMQCLEWSIINPDFIKNLFVIATNCKHSSWGIAFNEAQRMALELGDKGLDAARAIAMLSYRNYKTYEYSQVDHIDAADDFSAASYQRYQGEKLRKRFTPNAYYSLSKSMDSNNVGRNRGSLEKALSNITAQTLVIGIDSDILFPVNEQQYIAKNVENAVYEHIKSKYGHDGFILETDKIKTLLKKYFDFL